MLNVKLPYFKNPKQYFKFVKNIEKLIQKKFGKISKPIFHIIATMGSHIHK